MNGHFKHFRAACGYSLSGLKVLMGERAFQQEIFLIACFIALIAFLKGLGKTVDVFFPAVLMLITEALNTSIEKIVDICSPSYNELAKASKDAASFACSLSILFFIAKVLYVVSR